MRRRNFIATLAVAGIAGCQSKSQSASPTDVNSESSGNGEPTVKPTATDLGLNPDNRLDMGEWYSNSPLSFSVNEVVSKTEFKHSKMFTDEYESYEMPEDKQLTVAYIDVKNITNQVKYDPIGVFKIRLAGETYEPDESFSHPAVDGEFSVSRLKYTEEYSNIDTNPTENKGIESGEVAPMSVTAVTPRVSSSKATVLAKTWSAEGEKVREVVTAWS